MIGNLSRVMFAIGRLKATAAALTGSWLLVIVADVLLAELMPAREDPESGRLRPGLASR